MDVFNDLCITFETLVYNSDILLRYKHIYKSTQFSSTKIKETIRTMTTPPNTSFTTITCHLDFRLQGWSFTSKPKISLEWRICDTAKRMCKPMGYLYGRLPRILSEVPSEQKVVVLRCLLTLDGRTDSLIDGMWPRPAFQPLLQLDNNNKQQLYQQHCWL